jgi:DNA-binding MarR family transcriptional regulator
MRKAVAAGRTSVDRGPCEADSVSRMIAEWQRQRPDLDVSPLAILGRIQRLSTHLLRIAEGSLTRIGLTWETFSLIATLRRSGAPFALRPTDIYRQSLLTSGTVTKRIDNVERMGLVERIRDGKDRRSIVVRLTPKGRALADRAIDIHMSAMAEALSVFTRLERGNASALLSKLLVSIEEEPRRAARSGRQPRSRRSQMSKSTTAHNRST